MSETKRAVCVWERENDGLIFKIITNPIYQVGRAVVLVTAKKNCNALHSVENVSVDCWGCAENVMSLTSLQRVVRFMFFPLFPCKCPFLPSVLALIGQQLNGSICTVWEPCTIIFLRGTFDFLNEVNCYHRVLQSCNAIDYRDILVHNGPCGHRGH